MLTFSISLPIITLIFGMLFSTSILFVRFKARQFVKGHPEAFKVDVQQKLVNAGKTGKQKFAFLVNIIYLAGVVLLIGGFVFLAGAQQSDLTQLISLVVYFDSLLFYILLPLMIVANLIWGWSGRSAREESYAFQQKLASTSLRVKRIIGYVSWNAANALAIVAILVYYFAF